jgi:hypothetical protein
MPSLFVKPFSRRVNQWGNLSYLAGIQNNGPQSIDEALYDLDNTSVLFCNAWQRIPPDFARAARVSSNAMERLDHIVNEILRARDTKKAQGSYVGSQLEVQLKINRGLMSAPVTLAQQQTMIAAGPGLGQLPGAGTTITLERLLNKIKHRHHQSANFRIHSGRHIFVINVDNPNKTPDSIVEFDVIEFCKHCIEVAKHL